MDGCVLCFVMGYVVQFGKIALYFFNVYIIIITINF